MCSQRKGISNGGVPACSSSIKLDGENGQCAMTCERGFVSSGSAFGKFTCNLGQLSGPDLTCTAIKCDTTQLQMANSERADGITSAILDFGQEVSFKCKDGYEIKDQTNFDPSSDDQTCDRHWEDSYAPQHNTECKVII